MDKSVVSAPPDIWAEPPASVVRAELWPAYHVRMGIVAPRDTGNTPEHEGFDQASVTLDAAADALDTNSRFIRRIADASPILIYVFDRMLNRSVYCNQAITSILGYSEADLKRMGDSLLPELMHPDDRPMISALTARIEAAADDEMIEFECRLHHASGDWRWFAAREIVFLRDDAGVPRQMLGAATDITDRKLDEIALRDSQRRYAMASSAGRVVVWEYDVDSGTMRTEPPIGELLGFASGAYDDFDGWLEHIHPEDRDRVRRIGALGFDRTAPRNADGTTRCPESEYRMIGKDGAIYWLADRGTVEWHANGEPFRAIGAITDITARKRAEDQLRKVTGEILRVQDEERRRIAADLHDGVAQDLAAIIVNLLRIDQLASGLPREARAVLTATHDLTENTLRGLRTLSYLLHPPFLEQTGLPAAIHDYAAGFAKRTGIAVDTEGVEMIENVTRDAETALYRVVQECLVNIQRHSGSDVAAIRLTTLGGWIILQVRDDGRGFVISDPGGSGQTSGQVGVGIASMRERLRHLGGRLDIRSGPAGTTVSARLPAPAASARP